MEMQRLRNISTFIASWGLTCCASSLEVWSLTHQASGPEGINMRAHWLPMVAIGVLLGHPCGTHRWLFEFCTILQFDYREIGFDIAK